MSAPDLLGFSGDWATYVEVIYERYCDDLVRNERELWGRRVSTRYNPATNNKHFSFWHVISEGKVEVDRLPDLQRCSRVGWIAWVIESCHESAAGFSWWISERTTSRGRKKNLVLWAEADDFVVIVEPRQDYVLLVSAYPVQGRRAARLVIERDEYWNGQPMVPLW